MDKIRVLFLAADPFEQDAALRLDREIRRIKDAIESAEHRDLIEMIPEMAIQPATLRRLLLKHKPHIVHFSGHGTKAEQIILEDQNGQTKPVSKPALVGLFEALKENVRVVVLNACDTKPQAEAIKDVIDCAIGMNAEIGDAAAIAFSAAFYETLAFGRSVRTAFDLGINALMLEDIPEEKTPELLYRKGEVDPAKIVLVNPHSPRRRV